jgi:hypothetical protein
LTRARELFEASIAVSRSFGDEYEMTADLAILATIAAFAGDENAAAALLQQAVGLGQKLESRPLLTTRCLPAMAALLSQQGDTAMSVELIAAYEAQREEMGLPPSWISREYTRRILAAAAGKISEDRIEQALERGRALTLEEAFADAPAATMAAGPG